MSAPRKKTTKTTIPKAGIKKWQRLGKEFGYPQCCIDFFCGDWTAGRFNKMVMFKTDRVLLNNVYAALARAFGFVDSKDHGYIPCPACLCTKMEDGRVI